MRDRIAAMQLWSPPMSDVFRLENDDNMYISLRNMLIRFATEDNAGGQKRGGMTYHPYPSPNWNAQSGGIVNNSWTEGFDDWLREQTDRSDSDPPRFRTMITEFGWNPFNMTRCTLAQTSKWTAGPGGAIFERGTRCSSSDGQEHAFERDIDLFLRDHRHRAEIVAVWLVNDGDGSFNGITGGEEHAWFTSYKTSNPQYP